MTVDEVVDAVNGTAGLAGKVTASNDNGKLRIKNLSTENLTIAGADTALGTTGSATSIEGNATRANLVKQFNE
ncbi:hypothetical protein J8J27_34530, partial [Mycobacterium tuberculosis]|nr:hypothetical protein [Mycobacterium tuberculosis]